MAKNGQTFQSYSSELKLKAFELSELACQIGKLLESSGFVTVLKYKSGKRIFAYMRKLDYLIVEEGERTSDLERENHYLRMRVYVLKKYMEILKGREIEKYQVINQLREGIPSQI